MTSGELKGCGCPPHTDDRDIAPRRVELDGDAVVVVSEMQCGRCGKDSTTKQPYNPEVHGPRVGAASVESYDEYLERTRAAYAAEANRIRAELVGTVREAIYDIDRDRNPTLETAETGPRWSVEPAYRQEDYSAMAEAAVDTVTAFFATRQQFINTL